MPIYIIGKSMVASSILIAGLIGLAFTISNPIQLAHALNPQPLPPGIVLHFLPPLPPIPPGLNACISAALCHLSPGIASHYPPEPTLHLPPGLRSHFPPNPI